MTTAIATTDGKVNTIRTLLESNKAALFAAVPKHMTADRMIRVACTELRKNPVLAECNQRSLIGAIVEASQLGLEIGGVLGQAYLVPYNVKVKGINGAPDRWEKAAQLIPGYRGLVDIARRSGQISTIEARVVHSKDEFEFEFGLEPRLKHRPSTDQDPGVAQYIYAIAHLRDGGRQYELMTVREIEAIRARSKSSSNGPWVTDWEEMAKKTVLRRLCKLLPVSVEMQRAVALDEQDDTHRRPVILGDDLALPLPPPMDIDDGPELIEVEASQAPTGGTTSKVAEKTRQKRETKAKEEAAVEKPAVAEEPLFNRFIGYIEGMKDLADSDGLQMEIGEAVNANKLTAQQARTLADKLEIRRAILSGEG